MHIVCANCHAINRIPVDKTLTEAKCGKCKSAVYDAKPVVLNDQNFYRYIEKNHLPVIVDFWAPWCGPCKTMAPTFEAVANESVGLLFAKVNTEASVQVSSNANIRSIPSLIFFDNGQEIERISGALSAAQLKQWIIQVLQKQQ